jgi:hypothetical protein
VVGRPPPGLSRHYEGRVQRDRRVVTRKSRPLAGCYLTELVEPCGALPRKCYYYYYNWTDSVPTMGLTCGGNPRRNRATPAQRPLIGSIGNWSQPREGRLLRDLEVLVLRLCGWLWGPVPCCNLDSALENWTIRSLHNGDSDPKSGCSSSLVKWSQYFSKMWDASDG